MHQTAVNAIPQYCVRLPFHVEYATQWGENTDISSLPLAHMIQPLCFVSYGMTLTVHTLP